MLSVVLLFISNVPAGNLVLCREQNGAHERRVDRAWPPYSKQNYSSALKVEAGSWSLRNVATYLPDFTLLLPIRKFGCCPVETFDVVCCENGHFVVWRCVGRIHSIQANQPTNQRANSRASRRPSVCLASPALTASLGSVTDTLNCNWDCAYANDFPLAVEDYNAGKLRTFAQESIGLIRGHNYGWKIAYRVGSVLSSCGIREQVKSERQPNALAVLSPGGYINVWYISQTQGFRRSL